MIKNSDIAILILAAGESIRMGEPKQLLTWMGTTLLGNAINEAKMVSPEDVYVVLGGNFELIKEIDELKKVNSIYNPNFKIGQGSSLSFGINCILDKGVGYKAILIMLCDQPLINSDYLNKLIYNFRINHKGIVATKYQKKAGVPAIFQNGYFDELCNISGDKGASHIISGNSSNCILISAGDNIIDIDTKEDYQMLKNQFSF
ncbi:nucleotidyltransferase family protein [Aurantibacter sp.]|uniref:nucleotidyltransferase family protein n=1 Tax=Aurantibacter sp. TaxID=2807103 RepID=UPI003266107C